MSIDINWDALTGGDDGAALAETLRAFIHDRFQSVPLPRMIRSVHVRSFEFGDVPPTVELRDVCDPLPDFYEDEDDNDDQTLVHSESDPPPDLQGDRSVKDYHYRFPRLDGEDSSLTKTPLEDTRSSTYGYDGRSNHQAHFSNAGFSRTATPGMLGGISNLGYFQLPLSAGLSGTNTPLAAVAGAQFHTGRPGLHQPPISGHNRATSFGSVTSPSTPPTSRPTSRHQHDTHSMDYGYGFPQTDGQQSPPSKHPAAEASRSSEDLQIVSRITYAGNVRLSLTAEILLDYPMPSFVGIPLQLNITGLTFDGVAILAYIKHRAHFCFLSPEDADALVGADVDSNVANESDGTAPSSKRPQKAGGLLEEIKVESEIGQREGGRQVLKNVGKIEKFVLEQVRRIFEDEFVYPSFWTFLV